MHLDGLPIQRQLQGGRNVRNLLHFVGCSSISVLLDSSRNSLAIWALRELILGIPPELLWAPIRDPSSVTEPTQAQAKEGELRRVSSLPIFLSNRATLLSAPRVCQRIVPMKKVGGRQDPFFTIKAHSSLSDFGTQRIGRSARGDIR